VYQGFNEFCGWMHTSSDVDVSDMYAENIVTKPTGLVYEYQRTERHVVERKIAINVKTGTGVETKYFNAWFTHHGPVMTRRNGKYISVKKYESFHEKPGPKLAENESEGIGGF
jgi:acyl-homoserine lactone acylase PvdQ